MSLARSTLMACLALSSVSCVPPPYEPPSADQPHAIIKVRRTYDKTAGTHLQEAVDIDEYSALRLEAHSAVAESPRNDSVLTHPIAATFAIRAGFYHWQTKMVTESYRVSKTTYRMESYDCSSGFGSNRVSRRCTRNVPKTEYETKYRTVSKQVKVSDGDCTRTVRFAPQDQRVYLLQYTYHAPMACSLSCFEQVRGADGKFKNSPCSAPAE